MIEAPQKLLELPIWQGKITIEPLTGGRSNEAYIASDDTGRYVVRFCRDIPVHHVMRDHEAMVSKASADAGFSPEMVYYDHGTMVFKFIIAKTYARLDVQNNIDTLAIRMKDFHQQVAAKVSGPARLFCPFYVIGDYTRTLKAGNSMYLDRLDRFIKLADQFQSVQIPMFPVFAHNDFIPENILDDGDKLWFIDFEYAAFATPLFDLANLASMSSFSQLQDEQLLAGYFHKIPTPELIKAHAALKCVSFLRETMWSMVSQIHLNAPGIDYCAYVDEVTIELEKELDLYQSRFGKLDS